MQIFDLEKNVLAAFRTLQGGANTGKVVVRIPKTAPTPPRGTHLLSGGTGGLGLVTGRWLGEGGASSVVLAARGGKVAAADGEKLRKIAECSFSVVKCDAAELTDTARTVGAILARAARWRACGTRRACCRTGCCARRRRPRVKRVYAPKAVGAWALHACAARLAARRVRALLLDRGPARRDGQSNYAAANTCLDSLGGSRRMRRPHRVVGAVGPVGGRRHGGGRVGQRAHPGDGHRADWPRRGALTFQATLLPQAPSIVALWMVKWSKFLGLMMRCRRS